MTKMEYRKVGDTNLIVSRLCFGVLTIGPLQRNVTVDHGVRLLRTALDAGITFFDTAELYQTYPYLAQAFAACDRDDLVIATKSYAFSREGMQASLAQAQRELQLDTIPMFLLHEQESEHTLRGHWPAMEVLLEAKEQGRCRAVGISTHTVAAVRAAAAIPEIDVISPLVNCAGLGIQDGTREDMEQAMACAAAAGKFLYGMKPLGGGHLINRCREALAYAFGNPDLGAVAVGMKSEAEIRANIAVLTGGTYTAPAEERKLHIDSWCSGCGTCVTACSSRALRLSGETIVHEPTRCLFCGYCGAACPEFAIKVI